MIELRPLSEENLLNTIRRNATLGKDVRFSQQPAILRTRLSQADRISVTHDGPNMEMGSDTRRIIRRAPRSDLILRNC